MKYLFTATDDIEVSLRATCYELQVLLKSVEAAINMDVTDIETNDLDGNYYTLQRLEKELTYVLNNIGDDLKMKSDNICITYGDAQHV